MRSPLLFFFKVTKRSHLSSRANLETAVSQGNQSNEENKEDINQQKEKTETQENNQTRSTSPLERTALRTADKTTTPFKKTAGPSKRLLAPSFFSKKS